MPGHPSSCQASRSSRRNNRKAATTPRRRLVGVRECCMVAASNNLSTNTYGNQRARRDRERAPCRCQRDSKESEKRSPGTLVVPGPGRAEQGYPELLRNDAYTHPGRFDQAFPREPTAPSRHRLLIIMRNHYMCAKVGAHMYACGEI